MPDLGLRYIRDWMIDDNFISRMPTAHERNHFFEK